jgi:hypothetical protein
MKRKIVWFLIVLLILVGCKRDPLPSNAINRKTFVNMLVDMHVGEGMYQGRISLKLDSLQSKSIYLAVLKKYNVSEEKMMATTLYYSRHPKEYDKIYTEVISKITVMLDDLQGKKPEEKKEPEKKK